MAGCGRFSELSRRRASLAGVRDVSDDVEGSIVDLAARALDEAIAGAPPESRPILAEAALARFVVLAESRLRTPSGRPSRRALRALWADVAAELGVRTGEPALVLTAGLRRLLPADDRPPFEQLWRTGPPDPPGWIGTIGEVRLTGAIMTEDLAGDGYNLVLAYDDHAGGHTIVVYVDNNLGGIAKDVFPGPRVATVRATYGGQDDILVREVSVPQAVGLVEVALERTADAPPGYTSPDFEGFVDLLQLRLRDVRGPIEWPAPPPSFSPGARARLVRQFLRSDHVTELRMP